MNVKLRYRSWKLIKNNKKIEEFLIRLKVLWSWQQASFEIGLSDGVILE